MFGRSQSGPGGLSINTTSANTPLSLAKAQALTFGSGQSSLPPTSASKPTTSLFGSVGTSQPQQNTATTQAQQTSSIFGNASQPQQTGGLFGSLNQAGNTPQQQQPSTGSLFGTASQSQPQQAGGLFGSLGQPQNQSQQPQTSIFGGLGNTNKTSSAFGNTLAATQNQQPAAQPAPTSLFSSQIGQYQRQQTVPGVVINVNELRPTTRFNDLHDDLQKGIEYVDNFILSQIRKQEDCSSVNDTIDELALQMPSDIEYCAKTLETLQQALENDAQSIAFAKELVKTDFDDSQLSFKVVQNLSLPQQFHHSTLRSSAAPAQSRGLLFPNEGTEASSTNLVDYFMKQANEMDKTLDSYNRNMAEVEGYLRGVESNTTEQMQEIMVTRTHDGRERTAEDQVRELAVVLREFGHGIMGVATKVGDAREKTQEVMLGPFGHA